MNRLLYLDFELKIEREADGYLARVLHSPAGEASNSFTLPFSEDRLENLVLKIGRLRTTTRAIHTPEMEAARELGGKLFEAVFGNELRACLRSSLDLASRQEETGLRLKLRLQEVPELADLPWEFLLDPSRDRFLAQSNQTPIVRYLELPEHIKPLALELPLNVLVMISSPSDQVRLDVEREKSHLQDALRSLGEQGKVNVTWLENATLAALQRCLRGGTYHVFHFIGHGGFDGATQEGVLVLEDAQGRGWQAGAHRIGTHLHDHRSLRLAVLNSCEGARNSRTDPFAGVAGTLIRQGVPAVVAMQFEITDKAAITFASEFYSALAEGIPVDAAVAEARKAIYALPNDVEWATPVLYMRSPDGVLFNPSQAPPVEKPLPAPVKSAARPGKQKSAPKPERTTPAASEKAIVDSKRASAPKAKAKSEPSIRLRTVRPLLGHSKAVHSVAFSPDGLTVASCAATGLIFGDNTVRVWRVSDGRLMRTFTGHGHTVFSVAFSPDGQLLASGSADKTVRVWRLGKGKRSFELSAFEMSAVKSVAFSADGSRLASGSNDGGVRLWRPSDETLLRTMKGHNAPVESVAFSPDGMTLASGSSETAIQLWRFSKGTLLRSLESDTGTIRSLAFSPDGTMLASTSDDCDIRLWRVADGKRLRTFTGHTGGVTGVVFSPDGTMLASSSLDDTVVLWNLSNGKALLTLEGHTDCVYGVAFSPDGTMLASGSMDKTVRLWQLR